MTVYLDTSAIVPLFVTDTFSTASVEVLRSDVVGFIVSDWACLEVSNVLARQVRVCALSEEQASRALADFDIWRRRSTLSIEVSPVDVALATQWVRRFDLAIRGPDAVHLAMAQRMRATLATFDQRMAQVARLVGIPVFSQGAAIPP